MKIRKHLILYSTKIFSLLNFGFFTQRLKTLFRKKSPIFSSFQRLVFLCSIISDSLNEYLFFFGNYSSIHQYRLEMFALAYVQLLPVIPAVTPLQKPGAFCFIFSRDLSPLINPGPRKESIEDRLALS